MIPATLQSLAVPIASLKPYGRNARRGNVEVIRRSLERLGQYRPVVVRVGTNEVLAGNHTLAAALELGWTELAATFIEVDDETAARINLIDNRAPELGGYDERALADLLESLPTLDSTGFERSDLAALLASLEADREGADTKAEEPPAEPRTELGDLWVLDDHRLLCGDSTKAEAVERLLSGERAAIVYTDPPYGMSYRSQRLGGIQGDELRGGALEQLVRDALSLAVAHRAPGAATYVWCTWRTYPEFVTALGAADLQPSGCIVWAKGRIGPGSQHYRPEHEFCLYCHPDDGEHDLCLYCAGETWGGGRRESDVWHLPRDAMKYVHPTQKPTPLAERALRNSTVPGDVVLDLFGGSGSTLIAAENMRRRARVMELDPAYCDVIVDRWERHTGRPARLERGNGPA